LPLSPRLRAWLSFPRALTLALVLAAAVGAPSLFLGRFADDYLPLALMHHLGPIGGPLDLYRFGDGNPAHLHAIIERGPFPWWSLPDVRLSFWRPLWSGLASLEVLVLDLPVPLQHAHSVVWYLALVAAVGSLFRRLLPAQTAALAITVF